MDNSLVGLSRDLAKAKCQLINVNARTPDSTILSMKGGICRPHFDLTHLNFLFLLIYVIGTLFDVLSCEPKNQLIRSLKMKKTFLLIAGICLVFAGCAGPGQYNTQKGAAIGAGLGAIAGQAIGKNTESTLIGTGVGTLLGTILGNAEDQRIAQERYVQQQYPVQPSEEVRYVAPTPSVRTDPPGKWVTVPGHWDGNRWVPEHQEWRPIHPH